MRERCRREHIRRSSRNDVDRAHGETDGVLDLTQEQLAAMVGVSRQTMNKILQQLERQKLIRRQYGKIIAVNPEMLTQAYQESIGAC